MRLLYVEVIRPFQQQPLMSLFSVDVKSGEGTEPVSAKLPGSDAVALMALKVFARGAVTDQGDDRMTPESQRKPDRCRHTPAERATAQKRVLPG